MPFTVFDTKGLTINNLNKFVVQHFEDLALSGLKPNSDKTVTNPSLKAGVSGYTSYRGFSPDGTATVVVHVIYCQSLRHKENTWCLRGFVAKYFPRFSLIKVVIISEKVKKYCDIQNISCFYNYIE